PVLVALGFWQLDRAKEKRDLQEEYDRRANDEAIRITAQPQPVEALRFYRVIVTGEYDSEFQILLDNRCTEVRQATMC
ncbi:MAG: SURF1 family protein, partial [Gammaproteobacteria bacterium]|nr:SURF1 family protein [Gammaproteobacteria bacterium]